eukprot:SAG25_NODE_89_length_16305_cov_24.431630_3_plen_631_part_00
MSEAFVQACLQGDIAAARRFLAQGGDPNSEDQGFPALWCAAGKGHTEVLQLLLGAGAAVDRPDKAGTTPLFTASENGHAAVVGALLGGGAAVGAVDMYGYTALHRAAMKGHAAVVEALAGAGAGVDAATNNGHTPLSLAAQDGMTEAAAALLGAGADATRPTWKGKTAADLAQEKGRPAVVQLIEAHLAEKLEQLKQQGDKLGKEAEGLARRRAAKLEKPAGGGRMWGVKDLKAQALDAFSAEVSVWERQLTVQAQVAGLLKDREVSGLKVQHGQEVSDLRTQLAAELAAEKAAAAKAKADSLQQHGQEVSDLRAQLAAENAAAAKAKADSLHQHGQEVSDLRDKIRDLSQAWPAASLIRLKLGPQREQEAGARKQAGAEQIKQATATLAGLVQGLGFLRTRSVDLSDTRFGDVGLEQALEVAAACGPELDALYLPVPLPLPPEAVVQLKEACPRARCLALGGEVTAACFQEIVRQCTTPDRELADVLGQQVPNSISIFTGAPIAEGVPPASTSSTPDLEPEAGYPAEREQEPEPEPEPELQLGTASVAVMEPESEGAALQVTAAGHLVDPPMVAAAGTSTCYTLDLTDPLQFQHLTDAGLGAPAACAVLCAAAWMRADVVRCVRVCVRV